MAHALAPHAAERHFDRALLADDALVLHALVLAAQALVILDRPEDARAEQAVTLRLERAVVDGLGLLDLAVGPGQNLLRARDRNPDLVEDLRRDLRAEEIHHFLIHHHLLDRLSGPNSLSNDLPRGLPVCRLWAGKDEVGSGGARRSQGRFTLLLRHSARVP